MVLQNIHKMLKPGGVIIHASPSTNHVDHGFYMFSPTFFYDYYAANGYEIIKSYIFEYDKEHDTKPWTIYKYEPGCIDHMSFGGWGNKLLGIWFVVLKLQTSRYDIIPQQGWYKRAWSKVDENQAEVASSLFSVLKKLIKRSKILLGISRKIQFIIKKPPVLTRY